MTGGHGAVPSPASSGGHEDDHSQRLYVYPGDVGLMIGSITGYLQMRPWPWAL